MKKKREVEKEMKGGQEGERRTGKMKGKGERNEKTNRKGRDKKELE
jgi:hypothetical protein